jgi:SAM-dependent methyltransferase
MLETSQVRIEAELGPAERVLDIGGWAKPFPRADWVVDLMPYATRGLYAEGGVDPARERFTSETWLEGDVCAKPLPFADDEFDYVVCAHTLEDLRDPIAVCAEIARVGKRGYIEVPSRLDEQAWGVVGPFAGWSHHRWLIDLVDGDQLQFVHKPHALHALPAAQIPHEIHAALTPEQRVIRLFWTDTFGFFERSIFDQSEHDAYLAEAPRAAAELGGRPRSGLFRRRITRPRAS